MDFSKDVSVEGKSDLEVPEAVVGVPADIYGLVLVEEHRFVLPESQMDRLLEAMDAEPVEVTALKSCLHVRAFLCERLLSLHGPSCG